MGGDAFLHQVDVADSEQVRGLIAATVERYGRLDCAYNNAGVGGPAAEIADTEEKDFDQLVAVNFKGAWLCMKYEIEHMRSEERRVGKECVRKFRFRWSASHSTKIINNNRSSTRAKTFIKTIV